MTYKEFSINGIPVPRSQLDSSSRQFTEIFPDISIFAPYFKFAAVAQIMVSGVSPEDVFQYQNIGLVYAYNPGTEVVTLYPPKNFTRVNLGGTIISGSHTNDDRISSIRSHNPEAIIPFDT